VYQQSRIDKYIHYIADYDDDDSFEPMVYAESDGSSVSYGDTVDCDDTFSIDDGKQHGRMFLLNVLKSCTEATIKTGVEDATASSLELDDSGMFGSDKYMLLGLTVNTTDGFHDTHTKYGVGLTFS